MEVSGPVLFFDGECGLCARCVRLLLAVDRKKRLTFARLQGEVARDFLRERGLATDDFESAIFVRNWELRGDLAPVFKTDALLAALGAVGGLWRIFLCLKLLPRRWRDAFYDAVARRRLQFFTPVNGSHLSATPQQDRFLP
ncbi:MAG: DCC1-like thiol-disulfide oxidoreductase family protein [Nibricoccus sp.]